MSGVGFGLLIFPPSYLLVAPAMGAVAVQWALYGAKLEIEDKEIQMKYAQADVATAQFVMEGIRNGLATLEKESFEQSARTTYIKGNKNIKKQYLESLRTLKENFTESRKRIPTSKTFVHANVSLMEKNTYNILALCMP
ncbi:hypothetical protein HK096_000592 [Nowakowskiella sp. JEL0078]|nr:hypothetical protein HK096_000592 [Nowakowskiella sp. JEL0078]